MQLVGPEGYTLCRLVLQMEDVSDFVLEYVLVLNSDIESVKCSKHIYIIECHHTNTVIMLNI